MSAPTTEQMEMLLNFLEEHRELARGLLRSVEGRLQSQRLWDEICTTLNAMGGCTKTVTQWQRVWTDKKYLAKKNVAAARRSANATGGGPSSAPQLSRWDLKVLTIMGDGFGGPQTTARVPAFVEQETLPPSLTLPPPTHSSIELDSQAILDLPIIIDPPQSTGSLPVQPATSMGHQTPTPIQRSTTTRRERRARSLTDDSVRSRFFRIEEQHVAQQAGWSSEFSGIRMALTQLNSTLEGAFAEMCGLLREILQQQRRNI